jgi:hypothetical protein
MTVEEMQKKISELEEENRRLVILAQNHNKKQSTWPYSREELIPLNIWLSDINNISRTIRKCVFNETKHHKNRVGEYFVTPEQMSEDQYALYVEILNNIIQAIKDGREKAVKNNLSGW